MTPVCSRCQREADGQLCALAGDLHLCLNCTLYSARWHGLLPTRVAIPMHRVRVDIDMTALTPGEYRVGLDGKLRPWP